MINYLEKTVKVKMDRQLGKKVFHPEKLIDNL